jgi:16S rRNA (guanine(966)-N(2))-methyltransferase RsmD
MLRLLLLVLMISPTLPFLLQPAPRSSSPSNKVTSVLLAKPPRSLIPVEENTKITQLIRAKRKPLGHVVPKPVREAMGQADKRKAAAEEAAALAATNKDGRTRGGTGGRALGLQAQGKSANKLSSLASNASNLRVLVGAFKGKRLLSPDVYLRPMMGKVRAALFNSLGSMGMYKESFGTVSWLDIFAGSGSVGIESLSRTEASKVGGRSDFVDFSKDCCETVTKNLEMLGVADKGTVYCADAFKFLLTPDEFGVPPGTTYDVVSLTPPYEEVVYFELLSAASSSPLLHASSLVIVEYPIELGCLPHVFPKTNPGGRTLIGVRNRKYGRTAVAVYRVESGDWGRLEDCDSRGEEFVKF